MIGPSSEADAQTEPEQPVGGLVRQSAVEIGVDLDVVGYEILQAATHEGAVGCAVQIRKDLDSFHVGAPPFDGTAEQGAVRLLQIVAFARLAAQEAGQEARGPAVREVPLGSGVELVDR